MPLRNRWEGYAFIVGFWTVIGFIFMGAEMYGRFMNGEAITVPSPLWWLIGFYMWIPSTLVVYWLVIRFPITRATWYWTVPFHIIAAVWNCLLMATMYISLRYTWTILVYGETYDFLGALTRVFSMSLGVDSMFYLLILVGVYAFQYYNESRERMLEAADLKAKLADVQLRALKMQLHPHFLFNSFHTVSMLIRQKKDEEAIDMIAGLGTLLRYVLDHALEQKVTLRQEIRLLEHYLDIERIRFKDRLEVDLTVETDAYSAAVPNILLQPLVENSIRHGIVPAGHRGQISITARREGNQLRLKIQDNGVGLPSDWELTEQNGIGLANTRLRLERLYPEDHHFDFASVPEGGCLVNIVIPFEELTSETTAAKVSSSDSGETPLSNGKPPHGHSIALPFSIVIPSSPFSLSTAMSTIRTLIIDDEPEARLGLRSLLEKDDQISVVGECRDGREAVDVITSERPDLVLLDVEMPDLNGFQVLNNLSLPVLPVVIFVTAYDHYSLKAFDVHAVDYLLKPFTNRRFHEAIEQAKQKIRSQKDLSQLTERMNNLLARFDEQPTKAPAQVPTYLQRVAVKEGERITFLNVEQVDWIEAADNYICLHVGAKTYLLRSKLSDIEQQLDPSHFLRIHRSRIVNIDRICEMQPQGSGDCILVLKDGTQLTSSRTYREKRRQILNPLQNG